MSNSKALSVFNFNQKEVRAITIKGQIWFVAKDISEVLEYSDTQAMTRRLDDDELNTYTDNSSGQGRSISIINESGLYNAILGSNKPEAKTFKKWVTSEVLPTIRKTGEYTKNRNQEQILPGFYENEVTEYFEKPMGFIVLKSPNNFVECFPKGTLLFVNKDSNFNGSGYYLIKVGNALMVRFINKTKSSNAYVITTNYYKANPSPNERGFNIPEIYPDHVKSIIVGQVCGELSYLTDRIYSTLKTA